MRCRMLSDLTDNVLIEGLDVGHPVYFGFIESKDTVVAVVLGSDHSVFLHEAADEGLSVPISGVRMAQQDDLLRRIEKSFSAPFTVETIEVESSLLCECEAVPRLDEIPRPGDLVIRIYDTHKSIERFMFRLGDYVAYRFHKRDFF